MSKLGDYIELSDLKNTDQEYTKESVVGISTKKGFIETKGDLTEVDVRTYRIVKSRYFAYVEDTSRRGDKISLAFNSTQVTLLVSTISKIFYVKDENKLLPEYLFMYFNRPEFDRYSRFNSWGSARETFSYEDLCDIDINIPSIKKQRQVVDVYIALVENQQKYEKGLDELKVVCDAYIENLRRILPSVAIGKYIEEVDERNSDNKLKRAVGISVNGVFDSERTSNKDSLTSCKIVNNGNIIWASQTTCGIGIGAVGMFQEKKPAICAPTCAVIKTKAGLYNKYLLMWLRRTEFWRFATFYGSGVVEKFDIDLMSEVKIPIPNEQVQISISNVFDVYNKRKLISEKLKKSIQESCSVLIKGSLMI